MCGWFSRRGVGRELLPGLERQLFMPRLTLADPMRGRAHAARRPIGDRLHPSLGIVMLSGLMQLSDTR